MCLKKHNNNQPRTSVFCIHCRNQDEVKERGCLFRHKSESFAAAEVSKQITCNCVGCYEKVEVQLGCPFLHLARCPKGAECKGYAKKKCGLWHPITLEEAKVAKAVRLESVLATKDLPCQMFKFCGVGWDCKGRKTGKCLYQHIPPEGEELTAEEVAAREAGIRRWIEARAAKAKAPAKVLSLEEVAAKEAKSKRKIAERVAKRAEEAAAKKVADEEYAKEEAAKNNARASDFQICVELAPAQVLKYEGTWCDSESDTDTDLDHAFKLSPTAWLEKFQKDLGWHSVEEVAGLGVDDRESVVGPVASSPLLVVPSGSVGEAVVAVETNKTRSGGDDRKSNEGHAALSYSEAVSKGATRSGEDDRKDDGRQQQRAPVPSSSPLEHCSEKKRSKG